MATIQGVYVALFGRPADPTGLTYFNGVTKNGADLSAIGDLASTQEYKDRFAGQNNTQIVNSIYQSLFGRDAEAAGLTFFVNALNTGTLNINNIAIAILDGAQGTDKTIVTNKVAAADLYTSHLDTATEIGSYQGNAAAAQGRAFIATVTTTVPSAAAVDAAILSMQAAGAAGNTITFDATGTTYEVSNTTAYTNGLGVKTTTTGNNDTINAATYIVGSKIDGGLGIDTVTASVSAATALAADSFKFEILKLTSTNDASDVTGTNNISGLTQVWSVANSTAASLQVQNIDLGTQVGVTGDFAAKTNTFVFDSVDSGSTVKLALDGAKATAAGGVTIATAGTIEVSNANASDVGLTVDAKTINVSGSGTLKAAVTDANLETFNASSFSGNLTFDASGNAKIKAVTGGSGADTLTIDTGHTSDIKIDGGAGADVLKVNYTAAAAKAISLTGGADADQFVIGKTLTNITDKTSDASIAKTLVTINDFGTGSDVIKVTVDAGTAGALSHIVGTAEQAAINSKATFLEALTEAASYTAAHQATVFTYGGSAYIFVNDAGAAGSLDATDGLIKVTGVTDVATFTSSNLVFSA